MTNAHSQDHHIDNGANCTAACARLRLGVGCGTSSIWTMIRIRSFMPSSLCMCHLSAMLPDHIPAGSPSRGGDVKVCVSDLNQLSLPTLFTLFLCLFLSCGPFTCISVRKFSQFFPVLPVANTGSCVGPQNKIGHTVGCRFPC